MKIKTQSGNGDHCPVTAELPPEQRHGKMFVLSSGRQWCPVPTHDRDGTPAVYESNGRTPARRGS